jgi:hypothetical protein
VIALRSKKVLLFGRDLLHGLDSQSFQKHTSLSVDVFPFPTGQKLPDLAPYDLVVLRYSPFAKSPCDDSYESQVLVFEKRMTAALERGANFCILHHNEFVPRWQQGAGMRDCMDSEDVANCLTRQIGFRWLRQCVLSLRMTQSSISYWL